LPGTYVQSINNGVVTLSQNATTTDTAQCIFYRRILQGNDSNPRITPLVESDKRDFNIQYDRQIGIAHQVLIHKTSTLAPIIRSDKSWLLSFDSGATVTRCKTLAPIIDSGLQGLLWKILLEQ
jgi:hypothetical protein